MTLCVSDELFVFCQCGPLHGDGAYAPPFSWGAAQTDGIKPKTVRDTFSVSTVSIFSIFSTFSIVSIVSILSVLSIRRKGRVALLDIRARVRCS